MKKILIVFTAVLFISSLCFAEDMKTAPAPEKAKGINSQVSPKAKETSSKKSKNKVAKKKKQEEKK